MLLLRFLYMERNKCQLQVMVSTFGSEGINRISLSSHPMVEGVEYIVSWQTGDTPAAIPASMAMRPDMHIYPSSTKGLAVNRNLALSHATAPLLLVGDDDVCYSAESLKSVVDAFASHPDADFIAFQYESKNSAKSYPSAPHSLSHPPKGYYISSIEMAFRREAVGDKIRFNENFGIGATFPSGEEDLFLKDCLDAGLTCIFLPIAICRHDSPTTSARNLMLAARPQAKGAVFLRLHPGSWPLRMALHALRELPLWRKGLVPNPMSFCREWLRGVRKAKQLNLFQGHE